ncbi:MAG: helix-hairpin-helix domain-containing protein [Lachnospiraceae bacterium]|nr:helix-hairpin-helix domain-containing protein [Lachnospiraceae bacterium]
MKKKLMYAILAAMAVISGIVFTVKQYGNGEIFKYVKENRQDGEAEEEKVTDPENLRTSVETDQSRNGGAEDQEFGVFVCGQVQEAGIVYLKPGARIDDAIRLAGGFTDEADRTYWNLASYVYDGQRIYVPKTGEIMPYPDDVGNAYDSLGRLDLNAATVTMLMELPGIGEKRAGDIIKYREKAGRFTSVEQLNEISGIKGSVFAEIKDLVCVR